MNKPEVEAWLLRVRQMLDGAEKAPNKRAATVRIERAIAILEQLRGRMSIA